MIPGGLSGGETPVPISNTEVKPSSADGTTRTSVRESRSLPGFCFVWTTLKVTYADGAVRRV